MKVENMIGNCGKKVVNQFIITDNNGIYFQSYGSMIVKVDFASNCIEIGKNWDYSRTTTKYRNKFFEMYNLPLQSTKEVENCLKNKGFIDKFGEQWDVFLNEYL